MSRPTFTLSRTAVALLLLSALLSALLGCQDTRESAPSPTADGSSGAAEAAPRPPRFQGRLGVTVQAGLVGVGETGEGAACVSTRRRVCSMDGTSTYAPLEQPADAMIVGARAQLSPGHGDWTTTFRFDRASRQAVARATSTAAGVGGVLLVMTPDRRVLLAVGPRQVDQSVIRLTQLAKPEAWRLVTAIPGA